MSPLALSMAMVDVGQHGRMNVRLPVNDHIAA